MLILTNSVFHYTYAPLFIIIISIYIYIYIYKYYTTKI